MECAAFSCRRALNTKTVRQTRRPEQGPRPYDVATHEGRSDDFIVLEAISRGEPEQDRVYWPALRVQRDGPHELAGPKIDVGEWRKERRRGGAGPRGGDGGDCYERESPWTGPRTDFRIGSEWPRAQGLAEFSSNYRESRWNAT